MSDRLENNKVASRYAKALFESAVEAGELEAVARDLETLNAVLEQAPDFNRFMENPGIPQADKHKLVDEQLGKNATPLVSRILKLLVENKRMPVFAQMVQHFTELVNQRENITRAEVVTAVELEEELRERIRKTLEATLGFNRVEIQNRVDPGILGGAIIKVRDQVIDGSYVGRLEALRKEIGAL